MIGGIVLLRKSSILLWMLVLLFALTACNSNEKATTESKKSANNKAFEASIEKVNYVLLGNNDGISEDKNLGQIAVELKVKNISKNTIRLHADGIMLYDGEEQINPITDAYNSKIGFDYERNSDIGPDKMQSIMVVFEVEKDKEYEIGLKPTSDDYNEEIEELTLKLATADYAKGYDQLQDPAKAAIAYIETIYFDKENSDYEKFVTADKAAIQEEAKDLFKEKLKYVFDEDLAEKDVDKLYKSYKEVLAQKAKVEATTIANANGKAVVSIDNYTSVPLTDVFNKALKYEREFRDKTGSYDSEETDQYILSKFDSILNSLDTYNGKSEIKILMVQKDGKWELDTSDSYSNYVEQIFAEGSKY